MIYDKKQIIEFFNEKCENDKYVFYNNRAKPD